ncbi:hypothetical protein HZH66_008929 [Vespula vulgaris]|uniref:Uncharacterized protein n=1 Tax=Vespula vulgaris TaxID=7454 RepID=A0A834JRC8_VESVU|nr:hypothetical protein HZH66_008929 [Vespula vulgaris]
MVVMVASTLLVKEKQEEKKEDGWIGGTTFYRRIFVEKDRLPSMVAKTKDDEYVRGVWWEEEVEEEEEEEEKGSGKESFRVTWLLNLGWNALYGVDGGYGGFTRRYQGCTIECYRMTPKPLVNSQRIA